MNPLEQEIRNEIEADGPMPVARYMALCLGHPQHGYYVSRDPFGAGGDFVTAPEVSQMFGELIGLWCSEVWRLMGAPSHLHLAELGPGRGTLMNDFLRAARIAPEFRSALELHLVETSPKLIEKQHGVLQHAGVPLHWHSGADALPEAPLIVIANEFLDALPADQLVKSEQGWHERRIGLKDGKLALGAAPDPLPDIERYLPPAVLGAPAGSIYEQRDLSPIRNIARNVTQHGGAALFIDYGHGKSATGDTLQALRAHKFADPLADPGEADLTAHVDFEALAAFARREGAKVHGPVTQGTFLKRLGIGLRASSLKHGRDAAAAAEIDAALARLTSPSPGMGELFKVLAFTHPSLPVLPGFDS